MNEKLQPILDNSYLVGDVNKISLAIHNERCSAIRNILKNIQKD